MAYVITKPCIGVKDTARVDACPVDCIHPRPEDPAFATATQLYIDPRLCIDCNLCIDECPVRAIYRDDDVPVEWQEFVAANAAYFGDK
jgi:ferredoxin